MSLAFIGLPEAKEVSPLFMFDLAATAKHHLYHQQNMGTMKSLPSLITIILVRGPASLYGMQIENYSETMDNKALNILTEN